MSEFVAKQLLTIMSGGNPKRPVNLSVLEEFKKKLKLTIIEKVLKMKNLLITGQAKVLEEQLQLRHQTGYVYWCQLQSK